MRRGCLIGIAAALAFGSSCSAERDSYDATEEAMQEPAGPDISPSAAPGVAFRFSYDFRLDDERIDDVQEAHAARCESLGTERCRITGMQYRIDAQEQVYGMLEVKLDPRIARQFGKAAVAGVQDSGGRLINAEFSGEDEGSQIRSTESRRRQIETQIADIERRLAGTGPNDRERTELQQQLSQLRAQLAQAQTSISESEERLAFTPMTLNYYGKGGVPGFGGRNPVEDAWRTFVESGATMIQFLLLAIAVLLPWAVLLLLIVLLIRSRVGRAVRSWWGSSSYSQSQGQDQT